MRLKACKEAGLKEIPIIKASDLTEEQQREFIIKDNVGFGEWDWELIANEWDSEELSDWGLDVWQVPENNGSLDDFFEKSNEEEEREPIMKIILEFTKDQHDRVIQKFLEIGGSKESIILNLLNL